MKRLCLSAFLSLALLAVPAQQAKAEGCGFGFNFNLNFGASFSFSPCAPSCGPCAPCAPCYGFGPCFAPAYCQLAPYGVGIAQAPYGYPGLPGVAYGNPGPAYGNPQAAPARTPQASQPTSAKQVGYYPQAGYNAYAVPAYWYGR